MSPRLIRVLEHIIGQSQGIVFLGPGESATPGDGMGTISVPRDWFGANVEYRHLPPLSTSFSKDLVNVLHDTDEAAVYLLPVFGPRRMLPEELKSATDARDVGHFVVQEVLRATGRNRPMAFTGPQGWFASLSTQAFRKELQGRATWILDHSHELAGVHPHFRFQTIVLRPRDDEPEGADRVCRFFRIPDEAEDDQLLTDLSRLERQGGGQTEYGYVLRGSLSADRPWTFDFHHPELARKTDDLRAIGDLHRLEDLVEAFKGVNTQVQSEKIREKSGAGTIPLIEGRTLLRDGTIDLSATRHYVSDGVDAALREGDICVANIKAPDMPLRVAVVTSEVLPAAADHSVTILRSKADVSEVDRKVIVHYLRSDLAQHTLQARGRSHLVPVSHLLDLQVPVADPVIKTAVLNREEASASFDSWKSAADQAISSLFTGASVHESRATLLAAGRRSRQRHVAAGLVDDREYRFRTRYPHPIAYRWRSVEASSADLEGYQQILDCAEVTACYLALCGLATSHGSDVTVGYVKQMRERMTSRGHGTNFGDWIAILREIRDSKRFAQLESDTAFLELRHFMPQNSDADAALQRLKQRRDDQSHGRRVPESELSNAYRDARSELATFLDAVDFATDYPLVYIETLSVDTLAGTMSYVHRELMGDHPLVPLKTETCAVKHLEPKSLYLKDRSGDLHLLRPFLNRFVCPTCGSWGTFFLDLVTPEVCRLKSMEHGHSHEKSEMIDAFRAVELA